jgi:hypothetical protein
MNEGAIIFQNKNEIDFLKNKINFNNYDIYAWTAEAVHELSQLNFKFILPGDLSEKKFCLKKRLILIKKYANFIKEIDKIFSKNFYLKNKFYPFANFGLGIRNFFFFYHIEIDFIHKIIKKKYKKILYFYYENDSTNISRIIKLIKNKNIIRYNSTWTLKKNYNKIYNLNFENIYKNSIFKKLKKKIIRYKNLLIIRYKNLLHVGQNKFISDIFQNRRKNVLVLNTDFKHIETVINKFNKSKYNIFFWHDFNTEIYIKICKRNFFLNLIKNFKLKKYFINKNCNFFYEYIKDLKICLKSINLLYSNLNFFKNINKKYNFEKIICSYEDPLSLSISDYLNDIKSKTKIDVYLHGGTLGIYNPMYYPFQNDYIKKSGAQTNLFVYTERIKYNQKKLAKHYKTKTNYIVENNQYYKNIYSKNRIKNKIKKKYKICIVVGLFLDVCESNFGICRKPNMFKCIIDILNNIYDASHLKITLKCGYNFELEASRYLKEKFPKIKIIKSNKLLVNYINKFDIFILPTFGSAVSELCCTNKPFFIYFDHRIPHYEKKAMLKLKRRAFYAYSYKIFMKKIQLLNKKSFCKKIVTSLKNNSKTFLRHYCLENNKF